MKGFAIFVLVAVILGIIGSCSSGGSSSSSNNDSDRGGIFGHGEQYDRDVYYVADQFYG